MAKIFRSRGRRSISVMLASAAALMGLSACYQNPQSTLAAGEKGQISVSPQAAGSSVFVDEIGMPSTGWVVVHAVQDGVPDLTGSIGHIQVPAGPTEDITVPLDRPASPGEAVAVMLHLDTGAARVFEFANGAQEKLDMPVLRDGEPVMAMVTLN